jgi:hypothetical protein
MRVTDREVVQSTLDTGIATNRKICLVAIYVERTAMNTPDAYSGVAWFAWGKRHRQIVLSRSRPARSRIKDHVGRKFIREVIPVNHMHPWW